MPAGGRSALPEEAEVVVVGAGIIGVAVAYWLARLGVPALLLEASRPGWGASGRNAGLVLGGPPSLETMRAVLDEEGIDAAYEEPGHLALAASEGVLERFRAELATRPPTATPLHVLDRGECEALLGMRVAPSLLGGRWMPRAGAVHPARLLYGLAAAAERRGAAVVSRCRASCVRQPRGGGRWEVRTPRGAVRARQVVLACNVASARLLRPLRAVLSPARAQVLATGPLPPRFRPGMAIDYGAVYWRQTADGTVVLGGCHHLDPAAERTRRVALHAGIQAALARFLPAHFPELPPVRVAARWAGIMDATPDGRPLVGAWPEDSGLWVAAGFGGHGLPPALGVGRLLARAIAEGGGGGGGSRPAELDALAPARFREALAC